MTDTEMILKGLDLIDDYCTNCNAPEEEGSPLPCQECAKQVLARHDAEVRAKTIDDIITKLVAMEDEYRFDIRDKDCMQDDPFSDGILSAMFTVIQSIKRLKEQKE